MGRDLHEVNYRPRKGSGELKIAMYFDSETFRHVRTRYSYTISATIGTRQSSNQNPESYYSLIEDFDDFRDANGLMLPHKYRLQLSVQATTTPSLYDYNMTFNRSRTTSRWTRKCLCSSSRCFARDRRLWSLPRALTFGQPAQAGYQRQNRQGGPYTFYHRHPA